MPVARAAVPRASGARATTVTSWGACFTVDDVESVACVRRVREAKYLDLCLMVEHADRVVCARHQGAEPGP